ncbi:hypothetical protein OKJ48_11435 [Streptomyces kunmingensis]|uniref:DUF3040 domain-containing protein n=1 Tax=Streptomyces kunmingensis TaxID=68225 RepID=A0ABU6C809_9ACTN|nr:hypothetical protein [Streptomyces kunmingensis]MEB3960851.1 hypothetical protein [Streptomyces kunmingensis]
MDASTEAARGLTDIETFLYREAHLRAARRRVTDFTARAPGLTEEQKSGIERWYLEEQIYVARMVTDHIADSISVMEEQHRGRFGRWLRGTMIAMALITVVAGLCVTVVIGSLR